MPNIVPIATEVHPDEPAYGLVEIHRQSDGSKGWHRYQQIAVDRGDIIAIYEEDMGPKEHYSHPLRIPSFWEHTVGELLDMADQLRGEPYDQSHIRHQPLLEEYDKLWESAEGIKASRKQFKA